MTIMKYMSVLTACTVFAALISIVVESFRSLSQLKKVTNILTGLLAIESISKGTLKTQRPRIAVGYGACTDLLLPGTEFLNYTYDLEREVGPELRIDELKSEHELLRSFAYYFQNGAAAERIMPNEELFKKLIQIAKQRHRKEIQWFLGGNAPLMAVRFHIEGAIVLLGARMSKKLRRLVPTKIQIAGDEIDDDDIHIIMEYKAGEWWGPFKAPRANRFILHNDKNNAHLSSVEPFNKAMRSFAPNLLVISGLQMMDNYKFQEGVRESRLEKVQQQITSQHNSTLKHFEMASYVEIELLKMLQHYVLPYVDSIGMNEQELENLQNVLLYDRTTLATDWNPRVATTLDQMRSVFRFLAQDYFHSLGNILKRRLLTRMHVHTLAYQALLTVKNSTWRNPRGAAAKAAITAHRYVCQVDEINPESATLILDDSFATSTRFTHNQQVIRIAFNIENPVPCWDEAIDVAEDKTLDIEFCVAPVLVCRVAKKTAGAGDNISAAALFQQL